jgi:hypothetical protein
VYRAQRRAPGVFLQGMTDPAGGAGDREHRLRRVFRLVQPRAAATGKPLTDDELRLIAAYPHQLALLYPGLLS